MNFEQSALPKSIDGGYQNFKGTHSLCVALGKFLCVTILKYKKPMIIIRI